MRRAEIFPTVSWIDFSKMKLLQNCLWGLLIACFHFYVNTKMQKKRKYKPWVFLGRLISGFPALLSGLSFSQLISDPCVKLAVPARQKWIPVPVGSAGSGAPGISLKCFYGTGWTLQKEAAGDKMLPARRLVGTVGWIKNIMMSMQNVF